MRSAWLILTTGCVSLGTPHYFAFPGAQRVEPEQLTAPPLLSAPPEPSRFPETACSPGAVGSSCSTAARTARPSPQASLPIAPSCAPGSSGCSSQSGAALRVEQIAPNSARASVDAAAACALPSTSALPVCTEFFGVPLNGSSDIVFLLDRSVSMSETASFGDQGRQPGGDRVNGVAIGVPSHQSGPLLPDKLTVAKLELNKVLAHLPDGTRFAIGFFDDGMTWFAPELMVLNDHTRGAVVRFTDGIRPRGATATVPALEAAFSLKPRRVVLLTDGVANFDGTDAELLTLARAQIRAGVRFDTVSVSSVVGGEGDDALASLAKESGGLSQSY
jgi:hypothetical protein